MCIVLYVKLIWCNGVACSYGQFGGVHLPAVYMCIVLHVKLMWCNGFAEIYARSAMRCAKCGVAVLKVSMLNWGGQSAIGICALFYIYIYIDLPLDVPSLV